MENLTARQWMDAAAESAGHEAFTELIEHLTSHLEGADEADCPRCAELRAAYTKDLAERRTARQLEAVATVRVRRGL